MKESVLWINEENLQTGIWLKIIYPKEGYIKIENLQMEEISSQISLGFSYGAKNIPIEKNFTNYRNPLGGFVEFTRSTWFVSVGLGYIYSESNIGDYLLKTNVCYLSYVYARLRLRLFNNSIEVYGQGGLGYWQGSFQNTKYPSLTSYFPLEKDEGPAYVAGAGINYYLYGFFIGAQYIYWNSFSKAVFGTAPSPGSFTNQYKFIPGANFINAVFGYRFEL